MSVRLSVRGEGEEAKKKREREDGKRTREKVARNISMTLQY